MEGSRDLRQDGSSLSAHVAVTWHQSKPNIRGVRHWALTKQTKVCGNSLFTWLIWTGQNERSTRGDDLERWVVTKWWGQHQCRKLTRIVQQKRCSRNVLVNGFCLRHVRFSQGSGLCLVHTLSETLRSNQLKEIISTASSTIVWMLASVLVCLLGQRGERAPENKHLKYHRVSCVRPFFIWMNG